MSIQTDLKKARNYLEALPNGEEVWAIAAGIEEPHKRLEFCVQQLRAIKASIVSAKKYIYPPPVDIETFIGSDQYLCLPEVANSLIMPDLARMNNGHYVEAVLTGGIGAYKTTAALVSTAFQLYMMSKLKNPHGEFGLLASDEIVLVFQSVNGILSKTVDYQRFKAMIMRSPYFEQNFRFDRNIESEMRFPRRIIVKPLTGSDTAALGQNVIGGVIDEVNFMAITQNSKMSRDGGKHDQAWKNYQAIHRRRESRFMHQGDLPGLLCMVSSKQYPGDFTEIKADEARSQGKNTRIYVYDKRVWDVKPPETYSGVWFRIFIGDETRRARILDEDEMVGSDSPLIVKVPVEYRSSFEGDLMASLRDIAGVATRALHPYIMNVEQVASMFGSVESILSRESCDFDTTSLEILPRKIRNIKQPRFAHVDLALSKDSVGIACGFVSGFKTIARDSGDPEILPIIEYDFILQVNPPRDGEVIFSKIRSLFYKLREIGLPLKWITLDSFQSTDTRQILTQQGFVTGSQSMDTDVRAYDVFKTAILDGRIRAPEHEVAHDEITHLERDATVNRVDHPANGSKDCSDAMAGVLFGLTMRREIWAKHGVPIVRIPASLKDKIRQNKHGIDEVSGSRSIAAA